MQSIISQAERHADIESLLSRMYSTTRWRSTCFVAGIGLLALEIEQTATSFLSVSMSTSCNPAWSKNFLTGSVYVCRPLVSCRIPHKNWNYRTRLVLSCGFTTKLKSRPTTRQSTLTDAHARTRLCVRAFSVIAVRPQKWMEWAKDSFRKCLRRLLAFV